MQTWFTSMMRDLRAKLDAECHARHAFIANLRKQSRERRSELRADLHRGALAFRTRSCK